MLLLVLLSFLPSVASQSSASAWSSFRVLLLVGLNFLSLLLSFPCFSVLIRG